MLNLSPTNLEDNGDTPEVIVESASEDDDIDISQFVESVLEEPPEPEVVTPRPPPPLIYRTASNFQRSSLQGSVAVHNVTVAQPASPTVLTIASGPLQNLPVLYPGSSQNVQRFSPGPRSAVRTIRQNNGHSFISPNISITQLNWLRDCFTKMKNSSVTLSYQVKRLEDRFKLLAKGADVRRIVALAADLQALLKQTELGYRYLGSELSSSQQAWVKSHNERREALNKRIINRGPSILVRRQVLLPVSQENKQMSSALNTPVSPGSSLPPNMLISVNGSNHSLSITFENDSHNRSATPDLCAKYDIKPCHVLLERCDEGESKDSDDKDSSTDSDKDDDIQIVEELVVL